ncbi:MAG: hypothetical protein BEN18_03785 [Epulopiscium sp. Nuni2H_MBin001]|nr:MAG: hypothetical protein BEN18_03785 [Epulopiscium sp. Nuni2H_MBin001]
MTKKYGQTVLLQHLLVALLVGVTAKATYDDINFHLRDGGNLIFTKTAISTLDTPFDAHSLIKSYVNNVTKVIVKSPISYIYSSLPFTQQLPIFLPGGYITGAFDFEIPSGHDFINLDTGNVYTPVFPTPVVQNVDLSRFDDPEYLVSNFFVADAQLALDAALISQWDFEEFISRELTIDTSIEGPHVLIFHTHNTEVYIDEDWRDYENGGVIAIGNALADELERRFGLEVLHITDGYKIDSRNEYDVVDTIMPQIIADNPSLQLSIDLHSDGLDGIHLAGEVNGESSAKLMFVNGITQMRNGNGDLVYMQHLVNDNLEDNLALSMQAQIVGLTYYPDIMRRIYLKPYRYSTHMLPNSLLVEVGANTNTFAEALVAVQPLADIIGKVFNLY